MLPENQALALDHARQAYSGADGPRESCGLLVIRKGREVYWPCRNLGVGTDQFVIHPEDYAKADEQGQIVAVVHSHPGLPPEPSQADRVACADELKVGDCFLMQVASPVPNHAAIYLGDGLILHHLQGRLSSRDVYGGYWQKVTTHILRHGHNHSSW